jgi:hypothetical protein
MNILLKIKCIFVFIMLQTNMASSTGSGENLGETPPSITDLLTSMRLSPKETKVTDANKDNEVSTINRQRKKVSICNAVTFIPSEQPIQKEKPASSSAGNIMTYEEWLKLLNPTPAASLPTITFKSSETGSTYTLEYVIGTSIKDHVRLLKKNRILKEKDKSGYNYGSPVTCVPPVPEYILSGIGLNAINQETIITEKLANLLDSFNCVLSFCFDKESRIYTKHELTTCPNYRNFQQEEEAMKQIVDDFSRSTRNPNSSTATNVLHLGYSFKGGKIVSAFPEKLTSSK